MKKTRCSKVGRAAMSMMIGAALLASGQVLANTTNSVPASFSFESFSDGASIVGTNGWHGEEGSMVAVATNQPYTGQKPLPLAPHDRIAKLTGSVTNVFDGDTGETNVWMDLLIQPRRWQQEDPPGDVPADAQAVLYVDTNGFINAKCAFYPPEGGGSTNVWAKFQQLEIDTNDWMRLTMAFKYLAADGLSFYQIQVNNSEVLTNYYGGTAPGMYDTNGSWFLCLDQTAMAFESVSFSGNSQIDDLVITNGQPDITPSWVIQLIAGTGSMMTPSGAALVTNNGARTILVEANDAAGYELTNLWWGTGNDGNMATNPIALTNTLAMEYTFDPVITNYTLKSEAFRPGWQGVETDNGVLIQWLYDNNLDDYPSAAEAEMGNDDGDEKLNWEEFVTGTDPNDDTSYFQIVGQGSASASNNYVMYYITTNSGVMEPVDIYRTGDLQTGAWSVVGSDIPRTNNNVNGTSTWWDVTAPPSGPAFYKSVVDWAP